MKFFGFNSKNKKTKFRITDPDRKWVEDNFKWLIKVFGYPGRQIEQIKISEKYFPKTLTRGEDRTQNAIYDLCQLLSLDVEKMSFQIHKDLRDAYGIPYEMQGRPFEAETEILENAYKIHLAHSLIGKPRRLIFSLIYEFVKIRLIENKLQFDTGEDTSLFIFIAGIYFGFGIPLAQNLTDNGRVADGLWESRWHYVSEMPNEVMAFGLAVYSQLVDEDNPDWKKELPQELRLLFEGAINFLNESPSTIFSETELIANDLFHQADQLYQKNDFSTAIATSKRILFLTKDELMKSDVYNNIGYYQLRNGEFEKSTFNFRKALQIDSSNGYAYDNLGYSLIQLGRLEEAKQQLENAISTENNDNAYTYRNFALYHLAKNEIDKTRSNFQMAFEAESMPVDLLELHYANFLISQGEAVQGMEYLKKAVAKGEPESVKRMNELTNPKL